MDKKIKTTMEMVEHCDTFFNRYQPLFVNDETLLELWDCFRSKYSEFKQSYELTFENLDLSKEQLPQETKAYAKQIFKIGVFLQVLAEEEQPEDITKITIFDLNELCEQPVGALSQIAVTYQQLCTKHQKKLAPLGLTKGMLAGLEEILKELQELSTIKEMRNTNATIFSALNEAEECLKQIDVKLEQYKSMYSGVVLEYVAIRHTVLDLH